METTRAKTLYSLAPIAIREADIHDDQVNRLPLNNRERLGDIRRFSRDKFLMDRQLLNQRKAQEGIIVDN